MHCFCYGSNLNLPHLREFLNSHGVNIEKIGIHHPAILQDHQIRTNYLSSVHQAGACNIERWEGSTVEGLLIQISPAIRNVLRIKEGWPFCYREILVDVLAGDHREPLRAMTYIVAPGRRLNLDVPVTPRYRKLVLQGAKTARLSKPYQEQLARLLRSTHSAINIARNVAPDFPRLTA